LLLGQTKFIGKLLAWQQKFQNHQIGESAMRNHIPYVALTGALIACMQLEYIEKPIEEIHYSSEFEEQSSSSSEIFELQLQMGRHELAHRGISYYEAILICNKMSIEEELDSLYQYDKPVFISDSLFWLPNIRTLEDLSGYRLPTKEEWLLAKENRQIEKLDENVGEWLYGNVNSQYGAFELAPHFLKTVGLYKERENYPIYGMRVAKLVWIVK
jgi:hypothetical protein